MGACMRCRVGAVLLGFALCLSAGGAAAQAAGGNLQAFTRSQRYQSLLKDVISHIPDTIFRRCPGLVSPGSTVTIVKPVTFGQDGVPVSGLWRQSFPVKGCGNDTILNVFFSPTGDGKINAVLTIPGSTHADPILQRDSVTYARIGAEGAVRGCQAFIVINSAFEGYGLRKPQTADPGPGSRFRPWWEVWTLAGCGHVVDVPMDFVPDATGTQIIQPGGAVAR